MKLAVALENEKNRKEKESWNKIFLHKDGKFYHAYEWSAWLIKTFVCTEEFQKERGDNKLLSAFLYRTKNAEYAILGFPVESLSKYIPSYVDVTPQENDDLLITADVSFDDDVTYETLTETYEAWRAMCEVKDSKKQQNRDAQQNNTAVAISKSGIFNILSRVLSYPVEKSSPAENIEFISALKQQIASLL